MGENTKSDLDIKAVSIFLFISTFMYFSVNSNIFPFYGIIFSGYVAKMMWITSCLICLVCSYGFWTRKLFAWKIMMAYSILYLGNLVANFFFVSYEKANTIDIEQNSLDHSYSNFFFILFLLSNILFIFYLFKRKKVFTKGHYQDFVGKGGRP